MAKMASSQATRSSAVKLAGIGGRFIIRAAPPALGWNKKPRAAGVFNGAGKLAGETGEEEIGAAEHAGAHAGS